MDNKKRSILELNIAVVVMGMTTLFPKVIDLPVSYTVLGRSIITTIVVYGFIRLTKAKLNIRFDKHFAIVVFAGIFLMLHWVTLFKAIQVSTVSIGIISFYSYPTIVLFLESLVFKRKLHLLDICFALLVILGVILIVPDFNIENEYFYGVTLGIVSAFAYSIRMISSKKVLKIYSGEETMLYQVIVVGLCLIPVVWYFNQSFSNIIVSDINYIIVLGIFFTAFPHTLVVRSLVHLRPKTVGILSALQPLYSIAFAIILLGEIPPWNVFIGGGFIISTVVFETMRTRK